MAHSRSEIESPMLEDWEFEDELGIILDVGRFIVPNNYEEDTVARMSEHIINDGRRVVCRTASFREIDDLPITFAYIPYNYVAEFKNRVGVRFRVKDHLGDHHWLVLRSARATPIPGHATVRNEQKYNLVLTFAQVNPV
jgi:hypothetical protein